MQLIELTDFRACEQALKEPDLKQALYDEGAIVMERVLVTLHGEEHRQRRLAEMKVFRRDFFRRYEHEVIPAIFAEVLGAIRAENAHDKAVDLVTLGYRFMVYLAMNFAGIDLNERSEAEFEELIRMLRTFGVAATLGQSKRSEAEQAAERENIKATLAEFDRRFFTPSAQRRTKLIAQCEAGTLDAEALPMDVLTVLLREATALNIARDMVLRETAFYFLASAHTSVHSLTHAVHHLLDECDRSDTARSELEANPDRVQRFVHESFRLHPSSPIAKRRALAPVRFLDGQQAQRDDVVIINLRRANRDPSVFGDDAEQFQGERHVPPGVAETGVTFGIGMHACLGKNLAAGVLPRPQQRVDPEKRQLGTIPWIAHALLKAGVRRHPAQEGRLDASIERETWEHYPVQFEQSNP